MSKGRRRTVTTTTEEQPIDPNAEAQEELTPEELEKMEIGEIAHSLELGQTGTVRIFRRAPGETKQGYVGGMGIEMFRSGDALELIKHKYGGGDYMIQFVARGEGGREQIAASRSFSIDYRFKGEIDQQIAKPDTSAITLAIEKLAAAKGNDGGNSELLLGVMGMMQANMQAAAKQNQESMQQMVTLITSAMQSTAPKSPNFSDIGKFLTPFIPFLRDLIVRRSDPTGNFKDVLAMMKHSQQLLGNGRGGNSAETQEPERSSPSLVEKLLELAAPALMGLAPPMALQPPAGAALSPVGASVPTNDAVPGNATTAPADAPPDFNPNDPDMIRALLIQAIRSQYQKFLKAAAKDTDPSSYFDVIVDEYEDSNPAAIDMLIKILREPNWSETLFGARELPYQNWFEALRQEFLDYGKEEPNTAEAQQTR